MIDSFDNEHFFLSNFFPAPVFGFSTTEHYYQAAKSLDPEFWKQVREAKTPGRAKRLGRKAKLRRDWESVKVLVMEKALREKFKNEQLRDLLLETANEELVEGNRWHDNEWGDCGCKSCKDIPGKNILGKLLMQIREELRAEQEEGSQSQ